MRQLKTPTILLLAYIFLMPVSSLLAQNKIDFDYDYAVFRGAAGKSIFEVYYSFYQKDLNYLPADNGYSAVAQIDIKLYEKTSNELKFSGMYNVPSLLPDTSKESIEKMMIGQLTYQLAPGTYRLNISGRDSNNTANETKYQEDISIPDYSSNTALSDIEIASFIGKSNDKTGVFYKNTLEVVPNPDKLFGYSHNKIYYYYEAYGESGDTYTLVSSMTNLTKDKVYKQKTTSLQTKVDGRVEVGSFPLDSLPTDSYILSAKLIDSRNNILASTEKKFYVRNKELVSDTGYTTGGDDFLKSEYATMKEELVNQDYEITVYIRSEKERSTWNNLTSLDDKRKFLYNFWKARDTNPLTLQNEYKISYLKRVIEANKLVSEPFREGWRTDRGRVYVLFGKPDDIERHPYESSTKSYEIWKYDNLEGGATVVFIEGSPSGSGVYNQAHSTIRGEIRNDNWQTELSNF